MLAAGERSEPAGTDISRSEPAKLATEISSINESRQNQPCALSELLSIRLQMSSADDVALDYGCTAELCNSICKLNRRLRCAPPAATTLSRFALNHSKLMAAGLFTSRADRASR